MMACVRLITDGANKRNGDARRFATPHSSRRVTTVRGKKRRVRVKRGRENYVSRAFMSSVPRKTHGRSCCNRGLPFSTTLRAFSSSYLLLTSLPPSSVPPDSSLPS